MPQDTVYIANNASDTLSLPDTLKEALKGLPDSLRTEIFTGEKVGGPQNNNNDGLGPAITIYLGILLAVIVLPIVTKNIRSRWSRKKKVKDYETKEVVFDNILQHYNPYYKDLSEENKERFMKRTIEFMGSKEFQYLEIQPEEMMPLLISGAAVQLTFGLKNYLMDYFQTIYVIRDNYRYGLYNMPFEGHVNEDGVYLSWNNFIREYNDYTDGQNVGLHELAHALTYVNFTVSEGMDTSFHDKFKSFSKVARPEFEQMQQGKTNLLDKYAATNYQEFWAVCIENFFERSEDFKKQLPDIYFSLCNLLNQDPLLPQKIISQEELI